MATKAERKEWNDYFPDMEAAIESGAMDDIIQSMKTLIDERVDYLIGVGGVEKGSSKSNDEVVTEMIGFDNAAMVGGGSFTHYGNVGGVIHPRHYATSDLVGKIVRISPSVKPKYMAGLRIRVLGKKQKNWSVEYVDKPVGRNGRLATANQFACPLSLFDIAWK